MRSLLSASASVAEQHFDEAHLLAARCGVPFISARVSLTRACWHARHGNNAESVVAASEARAHFERLGASLFARRAAKMILTPVPGRPEAAPLSRLHVLSPAELRVTEVLVRGHTTRMAAEELFLSPKTVDFHVQQIYRKLSIRSRAELASVFERSQPRT